MNGKLSCKSGVGFLTSRNGDITEDAEKANELNKYFCSVFTSDDNCTPNFPRRVAENIFMSDVDFTSCTVFRALQSVNLATVLTPMVFLIVLLGDLEVRFLHPWLSYLEIFLMLARYLMRGGLHMLHLF